MGMRSTFINGYGFTIEKLELTDSIRFISSHKNTLRKLSKDYDENSLNIIENSICNNIHEENVDEYKTTEKFFESFPEIDSELEYEGLWKCSAELVTQIISEETGIGLSTLFSQEDCIGNECIMLTARLPWKFSEKERNITYKDMNTILKKYIEELNLNTEPGYLEIEYFG